MSKMSKTIRILIADDHEMFKDSLGDMLNDQKGMEVVGEAAHGEECLRAVRQLTPDMVLMDINMPGMSGLEATRKLKEEFPEVKIIILSTYEDEMHILDAFRAGADGYLPKTFPAAKLVEAIIRVQREGALVPETLLPKLLRGVRALGDNSPREGTVASLTEMELKILSLVKKGLQNKEIGAQLNINEKTVRNHLNTVFQKLEVPSRTAAIVKAIQRGILALEG